jgi:hypothetical protein
MIACSIFLHVSRARADQNDVKGRIPLLWFGVTGGFASQPYRYTTYEGTSMGFDPNTFAPIEVWTKTAGDRHVWRAWDWYEPRRIR